MTTRLFGQAVARLEDPRVLRGRASYLDDVDDHGALRAAFVRSSHAHARVRAIHAGPALAFPGVVAVLTAADLGGANGPFPHPTWFPPTEKLRTVVDPTVRPEVLRLLADGVVRYVGQAVAVVLAEDAYTAVDATELVEVDYEPLPVVPDIDTALSSGAPLVNPDWDDNVSARFAVHKGAVEEALATADVVVRGTFESARQAGSPMEARGVVAVPGGDPFALTVWSSTQAPHWLRDALPVPTGLQPEQIRVVAPDVGGGFGIKSMVYPEELLVPVVALRLGRPVKWVETRSEHFLAAVQSRDQRHRVELGLTSDGRILAMRDRYAVDVGASNVEGLVVPYNTAAHLQGPYRIPALTFECTCVLTNKAPLSAYRGAGRPEAVFATERALDLAARQLAIDPVELRRRNMIDTEEMPFDTGIPYRDGNRLLLDAGDPRGCLETAVRAIDYAGWRERQGGLRDGNRYVGVGVAAYVEGTGIGPGEVAHARLETSGRVRLSVALPSQGQGHATTLAQICADAVGMNLEDVTVVQGDTAEVVTGGGTIASRTAVVVGNAAAEAGRGLRDEILRVGADLLEAAPEDLEVSGDSVHVRGAPSRCVPLTDVAARGVGRAGGAELAATGEYSPPRVTFASGFHAAVVEVEPWTGRVRVLRYVVAHDCGNVINPAIVEGQVAGGVAQGIGAALFEQLVYDDTGQLVTGSFVDYLLPRATDLPNVEVHHIETPSTLNPLGIKGVGEAGTIGPPAAIAGAVEDALAAFGARVTRCPMPPGDVAALVDQERLPPPRDADLGRSVGSGAG